MIKQPFELAYYAGIIDAIAILRTRDVRDSALLPVVAIHGGSPPVMAAMANATRTKITVVNRDYQRQPCVAHCHEAHTHIVSTSSRWSVTGSRATILLHNVLPYLIIQKIETQALLDIGLTQRYSGSVVKDMRDLGYAVPELREQREPRISA